MSACYYFQPETALETGVTAANDAQIAADLNAALAALGPAPAKPPKAGHVVRFIRDSVNTWTLTESRLKDALRITSAAPPALHDHPTIYTLRYRVLRLLGDFPGALREIERQCARPDLTAAEVAGLVLYCERTGMAPVLTEAALAALGLERPSVGDPQAWYCDPAPQPGDALLQNDGAAIALYCQMSGREDTPELRAQLEVAGCLTARDSKISIWHGSVHRAGDQVTAGIRHAQEIRDAVQTAREKLIKADLTPIHQAIAEGRNAILLGAHIGGHIIHLTLPDIEASRVFIARGDRPRPGFEVLTTGGTANIGVKMVRLAKAMKLRRHLVVVLPDGPSGLDFETIEFGGVAVPIGMGAAALARMHPSTLFFMRGIWRGDHFEMQLIEGAQIDKGTEKAAANAAFVDLFTRGMQAALQGAPEDFSIPGYLCSRDTGPVGTDA